MTTPRLPLFELASETVQVNSVGWGPGTVSAANNTVLSEWDGLPYQAFNKGDRVGRIVDWIGGGTYAKKNETRDRYMERVYGSSATAGAQYDYVHDGNEDSTFQLVDSSKSIQRPQQRSYRRAIPNRRVFQGRGGGTMDYDGYGPASKLNRIMQKEQMRQRKQWQRRGGGGGMFGRMRRTQPAQGIKGRQPSVQVRTDWNVLEELDYQRLGKLHFPGIEPGQDIKGQTYGVLHFYNKAIDKVNVKQPIPLGKISGSAYNLKTTDDTVIQKLASDGVGNVFATDLILATLMAATRSVNSWDIIAYRVGDKLFFDKRSTGGVSSPVDALTVSETAIEPPTLDAHAFNNAVDLAAEAFYINQKFRRQVLNQTHPPNVFKCENELIPFEEPNKPANCAYKYRTWNLGTLDIGGKSTPITLVARTEHDAVTIGPGQETAKLTIKCFNEWDSSQSGGVDWRRTLETQKGAVLATEMKNNACKLAKWTLQAVLAGSDFIKLGYVSRANMRNSAHHVILSTQQFRPLEFASQISLQLDNCWGILRMLIDFFMKQPPGKYILLKDPHQPVVRIYSLPEGTFDSSSSEESSDSSDGGGDSSGAGTDDEEEPTDNAKSQLPKYKPPEVKKENEATDVKSPKKE